MQAIQMDFSKKQKIISEIFSAFFKSSLNFEHFQKNMTPIASVLPKLPTSKNAVG